MAYAQYAVFSATAADTISLSGDFVKVTAAYWVSSTGTVTASAASISGTTVTVPAGPSLDDGELFIAGARVQSVGSP